MPRLREAPEEGSQALPGAGAELEVGGHRVCTRRHVQNLHGGSRGEDSWVGRKISQGLTSPLIIAVTRSWPSPTSAPHAAPGRALAVSGTWQRVHGQGAPWAQARGGQVSGAPGRHLLRQRGVYLGSWGPGKAGARPLVQSCQGDTSTWILEAEDPHSVVEVNRGRGGGRPWLETSFSVPGGLGGPADRGPKLLPEPLAPPATPTSCFSCVLRPGPALPCPKALHLLYLGF